MKISKALIPLTLFCASFHIPANAQMIDAKKPVSGDPLIDHRIDNCEGTKGFGWLKYDPSGKVQLSDLCLNEETGTVVAAETLTDLELTAKSRNGRKFEDLASGASEYQRDRIEITGDQNAPGCTQDNVESLQFWVNNSSVKQVQGERTAWIHGYTVPATSAKPMKPTAKLVFGLRNITQTDTGSNTFPNGLIKNGDGDIYGDASFSDTDGSVSLTEGGGYNYGEVGGELSVIFPGNGEFTMSGSFVVKNQRLKGHEANEMIQISGDIVYFRGHVLGSSGEQLLGYGIVKGKLLDASGRVHSYRSTAYVISCMSFE
ncbi:hypothetical protein [Roseibium marinum]|uniref:Uncharacterized protein n=1 Tax=Roseibium marinum TaxID=281252 RepID=A0A2S3UJU2_9HYPH|nr:hypothetical protein [Roseibium marinum]POF27935.1 hypothetical protein CLV41_11916 [Roseibium marinum]